MSLIKFVLVFGSSACFLVYLGLFRTVLRDRLLATALLATAVLFIIFPDATTDVAHVLGVVRGADLLLYLCVVITAFMFVLVFSRLGKLDRAQTEIIRRLAIVNVRQPDGYRPPGASLRG